MPITRLLVLFLYGMFAAVIAVTRFSEYFKDDDLGGFTCPADQIDFAEENKGILEQCVLKCSKSSTCYGVFRHVGDKRCVGCRDRFLTNVSASLLSGTEYYRRSDLYKLVDNVTNWYDAKNHCEGLGGYLADIKSLEEEQYIFNYVGNPDQVRSFWIGATNLKSTDSFLWQDGTNVSDGYNSWYTEQPRYSPGHCTLMVFYAWAWVTTSCADYKAPSLCEFN